MCGVFQHYAAISLVDCSCGGKAELDYDGCGHELVFCMSCKFSIERYESRDLAKDWADAVSGRSNRRHLIF